LLRTPGAPLRRGGRGGALGPPRLGGGVTIADRAAPAKEADQDEGCAPAPAPTPALLVARFIQIGGYRGFTQRRRAAEKKRCFLLRAFARDSFLDGLVG